MHDADNCGLWRSRLLQASGWLPVTPCDDHATNATAVTFVSGSVKLDHTAAILDPVNDQTVWTAAAFTDSPLQTDWDTTCGQAGTPHGKRWADMVIGRVKP